MIDARTKRYAETLSRLIQKETISVENEKDRTKFYEFQELLLHSVKDITPMLD
jgi:hypothetical protein